MNKEENIRRFKPKKEKPKKEQIEANIKMLEEIKNTKFKRNEKDKDIKKG